MTVPRLLLDEQSDGGLNMAVDEVLLTSAAAGQTTLRMYGWTPATLSLGYFQSAAERELHPPSASCAIVRRASGGGAILHDRELTYSFAVPSAQRFARDAERYYDLFHAALIETLAEWNIAATFFHQCGGDCRAAGREFLCFARRSPNDVILKDWKIAGSAQRRHGAAILQHGSILLARSQFAPELPGIAELAGVEITPRDLLSRWLPKLEAGLGMKFAAGVLTAEERLAAEELRSERFAAADWTNRR